MEHVNFTAVIALVLGVAVFVTLLMLKNSNKVAAKRKKTTLGMIKVAGADLKFPDDDAAGHARAASKPATRTAQPAAAQQPPGQEEPDASEPEEDNCDDTKAISDDTPEEEAETGEGQYAEEEETGEAAEEQYAEESEEQYAEEGGEQYTEEGEEPSAEESGEQYAEEGEEPSAEEAGEEPANGETAETPAPTPAARPATARFPVADDDDPPLARFASNAMPPEESAGPSTARFSAKPAVAAKPATATKIAAVSVEPAAPKYGAAAKPQTAVKTAAVAPVIHKYGIAAKSAAVAKMAAADYEQYNEPVNTAGIPAADKPPVGIPKPVEPPPVYSALYKNQAPSNSKMRRSETVDMKDRCVLLAEDVDVNRELIAMFFEGTGVKFVFASDGQEAVDLFEADPDSFAMVLMDIHMPVMDGCDAARRIRAYKSDWAKQIPIIAMTADDAKEDIDRCFDAGMDDHIGKPIDMDALQQKVFDFVMNDER